MTNKQSLIFLSSMISTTFSLLGWLVISMSSSTPYIWFLSVPIIIFITIVACYVMTEAIERNRNDR